MIGSSARLGEENHSKGFFFPCPRTLSVFAFCEEIQLFGLEISGDLLSQATGALRLAQGGSDRRTGQSQKGPVLGTPGGPAPSDPELGCPASIHPPTRPRKARHGIEVFILSFMI